jgi:hypothetical protein
LRAKIDRNSVFLGRDPRIANRLAITVPYFNFYGFWKISHFCSKSKGVAYGFTENRQFGAKTDRNSVFLGRDPRIANRLSITVPYMNLYVFKKIHIFGQNPCVLAYGFTENCQFGAKTDRNSVFLGRGLRIANRLSITVPYFNFYGFWKISHFYSKSIGVSIRFYQKLLVWGKNWSKLRIPLSWPPYCVSVIYNGPVFQFLRVLKKFTFLLEIHGCLRFYRKLPVWGKNWSKLRISWSWPPYCKLVIYNGPVYEFICV